ncbi:transposase [Streptomyces sp. NPDC017964]|uniref:transposase n=1 Tax=Streptomyces sp. NPDC017964 TaxID=3365022 RepID=UPI0037A77CBF
MRRDKRTANHRRAVEKVAKLHRKIRLQRLDHAHKTALDLVRQHDFIPHEDLKIRNMVRRAAPKPDPDTSGAFLPNGASAKAGLNRSISDTGWGCS